MSGAYRVDPDAEPWDSILLGPDEFACRLGEPEDRTWGRDGREAVERLNAQHAELTTLRARLAEVERVLAEVRPVVDRATPGEWFATAYEHLPPGYGWTIGAPVGAVGDIDTPSTACTPEECGANAEAIVASVNAVRALFAAMEDRP